MSAPGAGIASMPMYDFPEIRAHTDALWRAIAVAIRDSGLAGVPDELVRPEGRLVDHWSRPDILLSHTCGYPVVSQLPDVFVVGSFSVAAGSGHPGRYRSVIVARADDPRMEGGLASFDGAAVAVNDEGSLSGWVSLGWALAGVGVRPGRITFTGQHALSVLAVRDGNADLASIDAHTYALLGQHRQDAIAGLAVVGHGPDVAVTPLITACEDRVQMLRDAVGTAISSLPAEVLRALMITGWVPHGRADHEPVAELARLAHAVLSAA